jgi:hypothetical protein
VSLPYHLTSNEIVDEIKRQFRPLVERGLKPDHIEISEQYAEQLDSKILRGHIITVAIDGSEAPAFGGVSVRLVKSPGHLRVVLA